MEAGRGPTALNSGSVPGIPRESRSVSLSSQTPRWQAEHGSSVIEMFGSEDVAVGATGGVAGSDHGDGGLFLVAQFACVLGTVLCPAIRLD